MKKRTLAWALSLLLALTACGGPDVGVISGPDGPTVLITGESSKETDPPPAEPAPEDADLPEAPGTGNGGEELPYEEVLPEDGAALDEDGTYNSAEDVSLYLYTFGRLPDNYITKAEARALGWTGGSVEKYAPGRAIGGDRFGNREGALPEGTYHECDIDTLGENSRGAKRLVYADDGRIYYTEDHYETFTLLYGEE